MGNLVDFWLGIQLVYELKFGDICLLAMIYIVDMYDWSIYDQ